MEESIGRWSDLFIFQLFFIASVFSLLKKIKIRILNFFVTLYALTIFLGSGLLSLPLLRSICVFQTSNTLVEKAIKMSCGSV